MLRIKYNETWILHSLNLYFQYVFVLNTQFLHHTFKLSVNWPVAVTFKYFKLEIRKNNLFSVITSFLLCCLYICLLFFCLKVATASEAVFPNNVKSV